ERGERVVERGDALPVRLRRGPRPRVAGGNRGLQAVRAERAAELLGSRQRGEAAADEELVPAGPVLIQEEDRLARRTDAGAQARGLDLHQGNQAVDLRLLRHEPGQDAAQAERVLAELRSDPVVPGGCGVALV